LSGLAQTTETLRPFGRKGKGGILSGHGKVTMEEGENMPIKKVNHIAIAVKDIDKGISFYRDILRLPYYGTQIVEAAGCFLPLTGKDDLSKELGTRRFLAVETWKSSWCRGLRTLRLSTGL
jgi:hypothetical protein